MPGAGPRCLSEEIFTSIIRQILIRSHCRKKIYFFQQLSLPDALERQGLSLKFVIKTDYVLDPWKIFRCPWMFSCDLESP